MRGMPASLITFDHLSVSEIISARISSGVLPRTSPPVAAAPQRALLVAVDLGRKDAPLEPELAEFAALTRAAGSR